MSLSYDAMDGPVISSARRALETNNVLLVLPWVPVASEEELRRSFERTVRERGLGKQIAEFVDMRFFESIVRLHMQGEGRTYGGLRPAGTGTNPVTLRVQSAVEEENPEKLIHFMITALEDQLLIRYREVVAHKGYDETDLTEAREYVRALTELTGYSERLYGTVTSSTRQEPPAAWEHHIVGGEAQPILVGEHRPATGD